jgi:AhpD family alkylhydroperoxidase
MTMTTKTLTAILLLGLAGTARAEGKGAAAQAARSDIQKTFGFGPQFLLKMPDAALPGLWEEMKTLQLSPSTALPGKNKELIGLGVASQIPCKYCIYAHTEFAKLNGASEAEVGEAVAMAGLTRHWSTFLNGTQTDEAKFRSEVAQIVANVKKGGKGGAPITITDGASALQDIAQTFGFTPDFLRRFPEGARAGAWREMKELQMNPNTALPGKEKELIGLAVAAQIPCRFCIIAHTEFAKLNGATEREINEAVAMASLTRNLSTLANGQQVDEAQFRRDIQRILKGAQQAAAKARTTAEAR